MDCRAGQGCAGPICTPGWAAGSLVPGLLSSSGLTRMGHSKSGSPFVSRSNLGSRTELYLNKSYNEFLENQSSDPALYVAPLNLITLHTIYMPHLMST